MHIWKASRAAALQHEVKEQQVDKWCRTVWFAPPEKEQVAYGNGKEQTNGNPSHIAVQSELKGNRSIQGGCWQLATAADSRETHTLMTS